MTEQIDEAFAAKMAEPAFVEFARRLDENINWPRFLPVLKVRPTAVSDWIVVLPSGREIALTDQEWNSAITTRANGEYACPAKEAK